MYGDTWSTRILCIIPVVYLQQTSHMRNVIMLPNQQSLHNAILIVLGYICQLHSYDI